MCDDRLAKLKQEVRGVLLSSPKGLTLNHFLKDYKDSIGRTFPFSELGYSSINDLMLDMTDVVKLNQGYRGGPTVLVPVVNEKVDHINKMVSHQKPTSNKNYINSVPRMCIQEEKIKKPAPPVEKKNYSKYETESHSYNGYHNKYSSEDYVSKYDDMVHYKSQNRYEDSNQRRYSNSHHDYQNVTIVHEDPVIQSQIVPSLLDIEGNQILDSYYPDTSAQYSFNNSEADTIYYDNEDDINNCVEDYHSDAILESGHYEDCTIDDEFERPPTPGEEIVNERMRSNFRELLDSHPNGIPLSKFCKLYKEKFRFPLNYTNYGVQSFEEMIRALPDVFTCKHHRPSQQLILYNSRSRVPPEDGPKWIPCDIVRNINELIENHSLGLNIPDLKILYKNSYHADLDVEGMGFESFESFLQSCSSINSKLVNGEYLILPRTLCQSTVDIEEINPLLPITEMKNLWRDHFTPDECDPSISYKPFVLIQNELDFSKKVFACDVISPYNIWLQMDDQRDDLSKLMLDLNSYYDSNESQHILREMFAIKDLVCAIRFDIDNRWHRAKILHPIGSLNKVKVLYVDYGTESVVDVTSIRKLKKIFWERLPVQAFQASLYGVLPKPENGSQWTEDCINFLYELCFEKKFKIQVQKDSIAKKEVILIDSKDSTMNDKLLAAGHAISVAHMVERDLEAERTMRNVRTPPGYPSKVMQSFIPPKNVVSLSTCDRIVYLREESVTLIKEMERLHVEISKMLLEANVLEEQVCKHPHQSPESFASCLNYINRIEGKMNESNHLVENTISSRGTIEECSNQMNGPCLSFNEQRRGSHQCVGQQCCGAPVPNHIMPPPGLAGSQYHLPENKPMQQSMMHPQSQTPLHQPFPRPPVHSNMGPHYMVNQNHFMGQPLMFPPYQNMVYQPQWHNNQWPAPVQNKVAVSPYMQRMIPPGLRPPMINMQTVVPPASTEAKEPKSGEHSQPDPNKAHPSGAHPEPTPSAPSLDLIEDKLTKCSVSEEIEEERNCSSMENEEAVLTSEASVERENSAESSVTVANRLSDDKAGSNQLIDCSHLTSKQAKKLESSESFNLTPPPNNVWSTTIFDLDCDKSSSVAPSYPDLPHEPTEEVEEESSKAHQSEYDEMVDDACDLAEPGKEVQNVMRICVADRRDQSFNMLLMLIGNSVAVLLQQLFTHYWWGDSPDNEAYNQIMQSLKDKSNKLAYSIFCADHERVFDKLRSEGAIADDDVYICVVNLVDVPQALDFICPQDKYDLTRVKEMFTGLSEQVLPEDVFWYMDGR